MKKKLFLLIMTMFSSVFVFSADLAQIMMVEGSAFTLIREGSSYVFDLGVDDVKGMTLYRGDTIMTEADTFIEIHLYKGSTMIKVAGNTTITIEQLDREGGGVFRLGYGRVRARVSGLSPRGEFYLLTNNAAAGVKGISADFGYDLLHVMTPGTDGKEVKSILNRIYSFEGDITAAVFSEGADTKGKKLDKPEATAVLAGNEMITLISGSAAVIPEKTRVEKEIVEFWKGHPFGKTSELSVQEDTGLNDLSVSSQTWEIPQGEGMRNRMKRAGAYTFGIGAGFLSMSLLAFLVSPPETRDGTRYFAGFSGGISLFGAGLVFGSYLYPEEESPLLDQ
jgi:hypothetical protein